MRKVILFQKRRAGDDRKSFFQWALDDQVTLVRGETSRQKVVRIERPALRPDRDW